MEQIDHFRRLGLFDSRVPRYTSYPTVPNFSPAVGAGFQAACLQALDPAVPVSVYLHIPFCERLCWYCACHTQGTKTLAPVEAYVAALEVELALVARHLPPGIRMGRLHWGGGTPTILTPALIGRLASAVRAVLPPAAAFEFSVEIDPTHVDRPKIAALAAEGLTRASLGIQDFDPVVQQAIGRVQGFGATRATVDDLRACGIASMNTDLVYGLPHQTAERLADTVRQVLTLSPDRVALFGYAHVPWMARRQQLIDEAALPGDVDRYGLATLAADLFSAAGFRRIGIDHFARDGDGLAVAARTGRLRRNFQGYTDDGCPTLIGLGASSISRFAEGYVQNAPATAVWQRLVNDGGLGGVRGHILDDEDRLRARAIEMLLCDFRLDFDALASQFGDAVAMIGPEASALASRFAGMVTVAPNRLSIRREATPLTRIMASAFDSYLDAGGRFSRAS